MNQQDIKNLIAEGVQESLYLDFKRGAALSDVNNKTRSELVKDVTGLANASGGRLIYGVKEDKDADGIPVASGLEPVTEAAITKDWLSSVIRDNTGPRFLAFDIEEIGVDGGRVVVIDVQQSRTAHQNHYDHCYYQRSGVRTSPIQDHQIRDLMARTVHPNPRVIVDLKRALITADLHRYEMDLGVSNEGLVTMEKWHLQLTVPAATLRNTSVNGVDPWSYHPHAALLVRRRGDLATISFGDPFVQQRLIVHPGQQFLSSELNPPPPLTLEVDHAIYRSLHDRDLSLHWTIYMNNSPPLSGRVPFNEWCAF